MFLLLQCLGACAPATAQDNHPDVIVFVLDTMRADHLDLSGDGTPTMRALAERGVVYENAHSVSSWTPPSIMSLMTGQYADRHGVLEGPIPKRAESAESGRELLPLPVLDKSTLTLAQHFRRNGYQTAGVTTNHLMLSRQGYARGFELYDKLGVDDMEVHPGPKTANPDAPQEWCLEARGQAPADAEKVHAKLLEFSDALETDPRPDFVWVHLMDAHQPYHRRAPGFVDEADPVDEMKSAYASEIAWMDHWVERIVADLEMEDAIIVVISDHGDAFGEHEKWGHGLNTRTWQEVNDVVFLVAGPGVPQGRVVRDNVSQVDLAPTLASLAGVRKLPQAVDGLDLTEPLPERAVIGYRGGLKTIETGTWMVVQDDWKLMQWRGGEALYRGDDEQTSLVEEDGTPLQTLREALDDYRATVVLRSPAETEIEVDEATLEGLRALGYLE
ncbi:MAG TPA: sulfatase [Myxococcota bacterium]|nr:sulfatase [Myxococcota bacterium]